jgi:hypothetical protein
MNQFWRQRKTPSADKEHKDGKGTRPKKEMVISSMENVTTVEKVGTKNQIVGRRKKKNIKGQRVLSPEVQKLCSIGS